MASIDIFDIKALKDKFNLENYIETGTGMGECLSHAFNFGFKLYRSVEINSIVYEEVVKKFSNNLLCQIYLGKSVEKLPEMIQGVEGNTLFWLDAHFPGCWKLNYKLDYEKDASIRIPLEHEINLLKTLRNLDKDVFILDDLRIYMDGNYGAGNWADRKQLGGDGIDFIYKNFEKTHDIEIDYRWEGSIIITPKEIL
jgi:hypothetical protein